MIYYDIACSKQLSKCMLQHLLMCYLDIDIRTYDLAVCMSSVIIKVVAKILFVLLQV